MSKRILLFTCFILMSVISFAQTKTVKGKVADEEGTAIAGANVIASNSKTGTQTDAQGNFTITVSGNPNLSISSVGFKTKSVSTRGTGDLMVSLERVVTSNDEVVVIGYQSVRRVDLAICSSG